MTLESCIEQALKNNLQVRIQRLAPEIARLSVSGAYGAYEPSFSANLTRSFRATPGGVEEETLVDIPQNESWSSSISLGLGGLLPTGLSYQMRGTFGDHDFTRGLSRERNASAYVGINLTQPLLKNFWIDGPRYAILVARKDLKISELSLRQQLINTITDVETAYLELIAARENVAVQKKALELAEELYRDNKKRVEVGALAPLDEKQAESQMAATRAALIAAQNNVKVRENTLKSLITDRFASMEGVRLVPSEALKALPHTFSLQDSWSKALSMRPDLLQARERLERQHITLKYRKNQLFPELDIVGSYGQRGQAHEISGALSGVDRGDNPEHSYGIVFRYPLGNRTARSQYRAAKVQVQQSLLQLKQIEQAVMVQVDNAISQARSALEQVEASRAAVEYAQIALDAEKKKLEEGKSTSFEVLRLQRDLTSRRSEYIRAVTDYNAALARLAQAEGSTLERHGVVVESD